ncbi:hypothetical protein AAE02nite_20980 [Adhaeribacter aerolatus]|uniref:DUF1444 family protein n=2 Tax=Adhaeribacter aerolatus TaxID=670289 RepID=A0A512AXK6_9BACT|nr:hypothetical protein AAE02nite_20980 [Adhaeribacter aerolatus]
MLELFGCKKKETDIVFEKFRTQIESQGLKIDTIDDEGLIHISKGDIDLKVNLDNLRKNYERDHDDSLIIDFVEVIFSQLEPFPVWETARNNIFISLYPSDFDFQDFLNKPVTDDFSRIFIHSGNNKFTWISKDDLTGWKITEDELEKAALTNGQLELNKATLQIDTIENHKLGFLETEHESLKASLLFSPNLMEKVKDELGWPVYAVIPVRDFCYLFSENDFDFFSGKLGKTVIEEYKESGYPITTELLKFSDKGIEAVGKYPRE